MIYGVFSIRDALTGYLPPTVERFDSAAVRNFEHAVLTPGTILDSHAGNFELVKIGTFDDETGALVALSPVEVVSSALSVQLKSSAESR